MEPLVIRKYKNRKLWNTATHSYIKLPELLDLVRSSEVPVQVVNHQEGTDITLEVLKSLLPLLKLSEGELVKLIRRKS